MKILAIERELPGATAEQFAALGKPEAARAWELTQAGVFREIYFCQDRSVAVIVLECADRAEAEHVLGTLPLVQAGLITFDVYPLRAYPGFARLFGE